MTATAQWLPRPPRSVAALLALALGAANVAAQDGEALPDGSTADRIDEIVVTSQRRSEPLGNHNGNIARLRRDTIDGTAHRHVSELLNQVAGVWISRGSGQENLTAIRSPVLTGAGSCGAFLVLADGIPSRPNGFCNVNQLFELNVEQAYAVEILRGPAGVLFGSNALHGVVNVISVAEDPQHTLSADFGSNGYSRLRVRWPLLANDNLRVAINAVNDDGFRNESGFKQQKANLQYLGDALGGKLTLALAASNLDQDTAGFIRGFEAYKDAAASRQNPNPEAFRRARSQRLHAHWQRQIGGQRSDSYIDVRPYLRHSDMRFLQHFLPGQPLEENGQHSAGLLTTLHVDQGRFQLATGIDLEWSDMYLKETQAAPATGSAFLVETRPVGRHYDFEVAGRTAALFANTQLHLSAASSLQLGLRAERLSYDYDNLMQSGNSRDDGSACGFGGCLYTRPDDRRDQFTSTTARAAVDHRFNDRWFGWIAVARGYRAPQITELYRLQSGQPSAALEAEFVNSVELGLRLHEGPLRFEWTVYSLRKQGSVLRDSQGFNVNGGRSAHHGSELMLNWRAGNRLTTGINVSYGRHKYTFDQIAARGETFASGRDIDTAPRWLANAELRYEISAAFSVATQLATTGPYYLDAENRFEYGGHTLLHGSATWRLKNDWSLHARLRNILDRRFADRADYAFGSYRYFPGRGREAFLEIRWDAR